MANVTIPNLTKATTIAPSTDLMVLEQTNGTRKATLSQIFTSSATSGSGLGITSGGVYAIKSGLDSDISDINTLLGSTSIASIGDGTVTGAVSQINSNLTTPIYFNINRGGDTEEIVNQHCYKVGSLVHIEFTAARSVVTSMDSVWAIIPRDYLPSSDVVTGLINRSDGESRAVACNIAPDTGFLSQVVFNSIPANLSTAFYVEYYV